MPPRPCARSNPSVPAGSGTNAAAPDAACRIGAAETKAAARSCSRTDGVDHSPSLCSGAPPSPFFVLLAAEAPSLSSESSAAETAAGRFALLLLRRGGLIVVVAAAWAAAIAIFSANANRGHGAALRNAAGTGLRVRAVRNEPVTSTKHGGKIHVNRRPAAARIQAAQSAALLVASASENKTSS